MTFNIYRYQVKSSKNQTVLYFLLMKNFSGSVLIDTQLSDSLDGLEHLVQTLNSPFLKLQ